MNDNNIDGMALAKERRMDEHPDNWGFKPAGDTRPTPETDSEESIKTKGKPSEWVSKEFARRLERERDAAYRTIQYLQQKLTP